MFREGILFIQAIPVSLQNLPHYQSDIAITLLRLHTTIGKHNPLILTYVYY